MKKLQKPCVDKALGLIDKEVTNRKRPSMSYEFYKVVHIISVLVLFVSMTAFLFTGKRGFTIFHGVGLLAILVSGFGLAARMGLVSGLPTWVYIKLGIWFVIGGMYAVAKRKLLPANVQLILWIVLGGVAVFAAVTKPLL